MFSSALGFVHGSGGGGDDGDQDMWVAAFGTVRAAWGLVLMAQPALVLDVLSGGRKGPWGAGWRRTMRVLGARHLIQGAVTVAGGAAGPDRAEPVLALGMLVDLAHAGTGLALGFARPNRRQLGHLDATLALWLAAAGAALSFRSGRG